jgi:protein-tyrosine phosphatase
MFFTFAPFSQEPPKASEIIPNLFVGNHESPNIYTWDLVVNCTTHIPMTEAKGRTNERIPILDHPAEAVRLFRILVETNILEKIHTALTEKKRVLVHCHQGAQRSPSVVACYIMKYYRIPPQQAVEIIRGKRAISLQWLNFKETLQKFWTHCVLRNLSAP